MLNFGFSKPLNLGMNFQKLLIFSDIIKLNPDSFVISALCYRSTDQWITFLGTKYRRYIEKLTGTYSVLQTSQTHGSKLGAAGMDP